MLKEKELFNNSLRNRFTFISIKLDLQNSQNKTNATLAKKILEKNLKKLSNKNFDKALKLVVISKEELMVYLITNFEKKRQWEVLI